MIKKTVLLFLLFGSTSWVAAEEEAFSFLLASSFDPKKHSTI